jgi:hypothetical protein
MIVFRSFPQEIREIVSIGTISGRESVTTGDTSFNWAKILALFVSLGYRRSCHENEQFVSTPRQLGF